MELLIARLVADTIFDNIEEEEVELCDEAEFVTVDRCKSEYDYFMTDNYGCNMLSSPENMSHLLDATYCYEEHVVRAVLTSWESIKWDVVVEIVKLRLFKTYTLYCQNVTAPVT